MVILILHNLIRHSINSCDCTECLDMLGMVAACEMSVCVCYKTSYLYLAPICGLMGMRTSISGCNYPEWLDMLGMATAYSMSLCVLSDTISVCRPQAVCYWVRGLP